MGMFRHSNASYGTAAALVLNLICAANAADVCNSPSFRLPTGSPFPLSAKGSPAIPKALAGGSFFKRSGGEPGCECDLAVAGAGAGATDFVVVMRGNNDGTFGQISDRSLFEVGKNPVLIARGPFNKDKSGLDDFLVVSGRPTERGQVTIFLSDKNGGPYKQVQGPEVGKGPSAIVTGDFNGDGNLDAAVANQLDGTVTILLGDGAGGFMPVVVSGIKGAPESLAAGSFSGAGALDDIAIGISEDVDGSPRSAVVIMRGSTSGAFAAGPSSPVGAKGSSGMSLAAANLNVAGQGRARDLVVAFTDREPNGLLNGKAVVLLSRDNGEFIPVTSAQILNIGATLRSVAVADLDGDGIVDLIVSTYSESPTAPDGTIRFFQGKARPAADAGFHENPAWKTISGSLGAPIRPKFVVVGKFGPTTPAGSVPNLGVVTINAPALETISVYLGNGPGAFVEPRTVATPLRGNARLYVTGNFHSVKGSEMNVRDIAYVSTNSDDKHVLSVALSNGAGGFHEPAEPGAVIPLGAKPALTAVGKFDDNGTDDIAVIDLNPEENRPILKILLGDGEGHFKRGDGVSEFSLSVGDKPIAIVTGKFRNPNVPFDDIAVVSDTTQVESARSGKITVFANNGKGEFPEKFETALNFRPAAAVGSGNLRSGGRYDLIIRDANLNRITVRFNLGDGRFRTGGTFDAAGNANPLILGKATASNPLSKFDDIITFDQDRTIRIFENDGAEGFKALEPNVILKNQFGSPEGVGLAENGQTREQLVVLNDFGDAKLGLAMRADRPHTGGIGILGIAVLKGDGRGGFVDPSFIPINRVELARAVMERGTPHVVRVFGSASTRPKKEEAFALLYSALISGQFINSLQGTNSPDLALAVTAVSFVTRPDSCATPFCLVQMNYPAVILFGNTCGGG